MGFVWVFTRNFLYNVFISTDLKNPVAIDVQLRQQTPSEMWEVGQLNISGPYATEEHAKTEFEEELKKDL